MTVKKCSFCGENATTWGRNFPCYASETPTFEDHLPEQPELSAMARGFSAGDVVRNKRGHIGIVTYANHKWGDIRIRMRGKYASEFSSVAMGWRVVKKASPEQAKRWLAEERARATQEFSGLNSDFRIDPVTNETVFLPKDDYWTSKISGDIRGTEIHDLIQKIFQKS